MEQLLQREDIVGKLVENYKRSHSNSQLLTCFQDGENQKNNIFFSSEELRISLCLYIDDFEVCNPLGTSHKKQTLCGLLDSGQLAFWLQLSPFFNLLGTVV